MTGRILIVCALVFALSGCAVSRQDAARRCSAIPIPDPPERFDWKQDGQQEKPGTLYLDPYHKLKGGETWKAPEDGGVCLTPKAWRGVRHGITEWPKWGDMVQGIVRSHNEGIPAIKPTENPSWWSRLWGK